MTVETKATASPTPSPSPSPLSRPALWLAAWGIAFIGARLVLDGAGGGTGLRVSAALAPVPLAAIALFAVVRSARGLDELEQRIQLEALAVAFVLGMLLMMTLGLLELAVDLNRHDWSYRHVWAMLPTLYFLGLVLARRRYA